MSRLATRLRLPQRDGTLVLFEPGPAGVFDRPQRALQSRVAIAAAHVVADPLAENIPGGPARLDWDLTLAYRRHLWSWGLGVAEAMDTAQRGAGLDWPVAAELIRRSLHEAREAGGHVVCGVGTDQLPAGSARSLADIERAYEEQCAEVEAEGGQVVLMASRELARIASGPDDYARVYGRILGRLSRPAIIHWLGDAFDPALAGYWGSAELDRATTSCLDIIAANRERVDGVKVSLLDAEQEIEMRRRLPAGVRMYTGDDFNFPSLIEGDERGHSDALLGIFDAIAPAASAALQALDAGELALYRERLAPTVALSRHIFQTPTSNYKTGVVFMAYLNGHQRHFRMVGAQEGMRSVLHLSELFRLADRAGLFPDLELAVDRMRCFLALAGVD
ncbi:MAG: dihydrodipicolinate synthase family protein [Candidatus Dormibacteraeota bacterium]|nr:dihydrodipicolinate synthase family protein [Candidatus Dormibacteraeota bacterium]